MRLLPKFISHAIKKIYLLTLINSSGLFDSEWYKKKYLKKSKIRMKPLKHYLLIGFWDGNSPSPKFSSSRYEAAYPLVKAQGRNPLLHYLEYGRFNGYVRYPEEGIGELNNTKNHVKPLISIIVTSYNYAQFISQTLDSLLEQTYSNYEIIVVDDGSKDNSVEIINKYISKSNKIRLLLHPNNTNKGIIASLQLGISNAKGEFVAFCESDDYWANNHLAKKVEMINKYKGVNIISNNIRLVGEKRCVEQRKEYISFVRKLLRNGGNKIDLLHNQEVNFIPTFSSVMVKTDIIKSLDFNSIIPAWIDFWLYRQILKNNLLFYVKEEITSWRQHTSYNGVDYIEDKALNNNLLFIPTSNKLIGIKNSFLVGEGLDSVVNSPLFNKSYYKKNATNSFYGLKPAMHYCAVGWKEGLNPSADFDNDAYLTQHAELIPANICPLDHYECGGRKEGRIIHTVREVEEHCLRDTDIAKINAIDNNQKKVLLFSHELTMTGAPRALLYLATSLKKQGAYPVIISRQGGNLEPEIKAAGIDYKVVYSLLSHRVSTVENSKTFAEYASCFDVVLFNTIATLPIIRVLNEVTAQKVCWVHEGWISIQNFTYNNKASQYLDLFDEILVVGSYAEKILKKTYPDLKNVKQFLYGINELESSIAAPKQNSSKIKFILAATIDVRKGHNLLLDALRILPPEIQNRIDITVVGSEFDKNLAGMLRAENTVDIHVMGEVKHDEIIDMISQSDVLLCTSIDDPMPISCTEAMMLGVPTLVSDNTGTASFIKDGINGFIFKSGDVKMLAKKLTHIVNNADSLPAIGQKSTDIYKTHFSPSSFDNSVKNTFL